MTAEVQPIQDSYWVEPGKLMAGEYPGAKDEALARRKLRWLLSQEIEVWIDLTESGESHLRPYLPLLQEEAAALGRSFEHRRMPIHDLGTVPADEMRQILDAVQAAIEAGKRVYVHCWGGVGRTGLVVGCYMRRCGLSGEEALMKIAMLRAWMPDGWRKSPETDEQRRMVVGWEE